MRILKSFMPLGKYCHQSKQQHLTQRQRCIYSRSSSAELSIRNTVVRHISGLFSKIFFGMAKDSTSSNLEEMSSYVCKTKATQHSKENELLKGRLTNLEKKVDNLYGSLNRPGNKVPVEKLLERLKICDVVIGQYQDKIRHLEVMEKVMAKANKDKVEDLSRNLEICDRIIANQQHDLDLQ